MIGRAIFSPRQLFSGCTSTCGLSTIRYPRGSCRSVAVRTTAAAATAASAATAATSPTCSSLLRKPARRRLFLFDKTQPNVFVRSDGVCCVSPVEEYYASSSACSSSSGFYDARCTYTSNSRQFNVQCNGCSRSLSIKGLNGDHAAALHRWGVRTGGFLFGCRFLSTSCETSGLHMISGKGFSAYKVFVTWGNRRLEFYVCGLDPDSGGVSKEVSSSSSSSPSSSSSSSFSCLSAVSAAKVLQPDIVMVGLGYLDREKMFETFSVEKLLRCRQPEAVEVVIKRDNGQFIPLMQFLILKNIQYYLVGRDRLVEMGALGRELLWRPGEIYYLFFSLLKSKKQKENKLTPSLNRVLAEEGSRFTTLKIHQLLLQWFSQDKTADTPEPEHEFREQTFINKWAIGRSERECALLLRAQQLEKTKPPLSDALREKKNMKILLVCDVAMQRRLAERLQTELNGCLRGNKEPLYKEMMQLQDTSSTRFHLCLMIYFILPVATLCRFLWKRAKKAYLQYAVVGTTVTVGGDEVLSRLRSGVEEETEEGNKEKPNAKDKLEIVESRWLGFKHVVRDTSRD